MTFVLASQNQLAIKEESTSGTAVSLAGADVDFRAMDVSFVVNPDVHPQDLFGPDMSELPDLIGNIPVDISFTTYLAGGGAVDTPAGWAKQLIHANMLETVNASTSVVYTPETAATSESATIGVWSPPTSGTSGLLAQAKGCRPSQVSFTFEPGAPIKVTSTWRGAFVSYTDASAFTSVTYQTTSPLKAYKLGMTIASWSPFWKSFNLNMDFDLAQIDNPGDASETSGISHYEITGRKVSGDLAIIDTLVADEGHFADMLAETLQAFTMTAGSVTGNKVTIAMPKMQLLPGSQSDVEGLLGRSIPWKANKSAAAGNDEISITTT